MKKMLLALVLSASAAFASAQTTVPVYWPFSLSGQSVAMTRNLIDSANSRQSKYLFVFTHKPGAGGTIAAQSVLAEKELAVLVTSSSFYIRPLLFSESHEVEKFSMTNTLCVNQPLGIFSKTISSVADAKGRQITSGINPGSITQLVNEAIRANNPDIKIVDVPYKGTPEAAVDMMGGHIDGAVDFTGKSSYTRFPSEVKVVGITGTKPYPGMQTFHSQKVKGLDNVVASFYIFVPATVSKEQQEEVSQLFYASFNDAVKDKCEEDFGHLQKTPYNQLEQLNQRNYQFWRQTTNNIKKQ